MAASEITCLGRRAGPREMTRYCGLRRAISPTEHARRCDSADFFAQFAEILDEVAGKAVVVVDHQKHFGTLGGRAPPVRGAAVFFG